MASSHRATECLAVFATPHRWVLNANDIDAGHYDVMRHGQINGSPSPRLHVNAVEIGEAKYIQRQSLLCPDLIVSSTAWVTDEIRQDETPGGEHLLQTGLDFMRCHTVGVERPTLAMPRLPSIRTAMAAKV